MKVIPFYLFPVVFLDVSCKVLVESVIVNLMYFVLFIKRIVIIIVVDHGH